MKTPSQILRDALGLLGPNGERWVNRIPNKPNTFCGVVAIDRAWQATDSHGNAYRQAIGFLRKAAQIPEGLYASKWNDAATWPEVRQAFLKAIELAEAQAA